MPSFTIGEDARATVIGPYGQIDIDEQTKFQVNPNQSIVKVQDLNGVTNTRTVVQGTSGNIGFARTGPELDQLATKMYQDWKAGNPIPKGSITYTISEDDGSETTVHLSPVSYAIKDIGSFVPMKTVMQSLDFQCENGGVQA